MTSSVSIKRLDDLNEAIDAIKTNDIEQALKVLDVILEKHPASPEALHLLGICSVILGDVGQGINLIIQAHEIDGECRDYVDALASLKASVGDLNASLYFAKLATTLEPHPELADLTPASMRNYAGSLSSAKLTSYLLNAKLNYASRYFTEAVDMCERELRVNPTSTKALHLLGLSLIETGDPAHAEKALSAAAQLEQDNVETLTAQGRALLMKGKNSEAIACFEHAQSLSDDDISAASAHIQALSFMDDEHWQTRKEVEDVILTRAKAMGVEAIDGGDEATSGKIRIGILGDVFYKSDDALAVEAFLKNYDRNRFEVYCLQQVNTQDKTADRFKTLCDSWRPVFDLDDWTLASIISGDGIHALIDITGFGTAQRRAVLCAKTAPLQVAWLNHLDGSGKDAINLVLSDSITSENDRRSAVDGQDVAEMETGLFAFEAFDQIGEPTPLPALEHETITFAAYVDAARLTPQIARTWSRILKAVPNSLLALNVTPKLNDAVKATLSARFAHFGMSRRVIFYDPTEEQLIRKDMDQEFVAGIDVLLDAPVNSSAARVARTLSMGVPVLTLDCGRRSGQIAASVLNAAGKSEWIAEDADELVKIASELTADFQALAEIRKTLRDSILDSSLFQ